MATRLFQRIITVSSIFCREGRLRQSRGLSMGANWIRREDPAERVPYLLLCLAIKFAWIVVCRPQILWL